MPQGEGEAEDAEDDDDDYPGEGEGSCVCGLVVCWVVDIGHFDEPGGGWQPFPCPPDRAVGVFAFVMIEMDAL